MFIDKNHFQLSLKQKVILNTVLCLMYLLSGNLGLLFKTYNASSSPLWPPIGIALAFAILFRLPTIIPGMVMGVALLAMKSHYPLLTTLGLIGANFVEVLIASTFLLSVGKGKLSFRSPKDILFFILIGVALAPLVASSMAIPFLFYGNVIKIELVPRMWTSLFVADSLGILVFTPFVLGLFYKERKELVSLESIFVFLTLGIVCFWAFEGDPVKKFIVIPFLTWVAIRFSYVGASLSTMIVILIAIWRSTFLWGVFDKTSPEADLFWIQCLAAGVAITGYFMATIMEAQATAEEKEIELTINLENKKIAEEALAILDQAFEKSPIGFSLVDRSYCYIRINPVMAKLAGKSVHKLLGQSLKGLDPEVLEKVIPYLEKVFETGETFMYIPIRIKSGTSEMISGMVSYYPIRHPITNEIFAVAISFQDITKQLKTQTLLKENQDRLKFAQEAGRIGAFEWCLQTNEVIWTSELENIYGLSNGEFGGLFESWLKLIHPEDVENVRTELKRSIQNRGEINLQFRILTKKNEIRWILCRGKMASDLYANHSKIIGINIDLTEQKSIEQKLRLTEANLLHALSVRDEFMAIASHELKTPLTSLKLQSQIFQRSLQRHHDLNFTPEKIHDLLDKNTRHIDRLTRLVDDMLDLSRIRTGKFSMRKERCELKTMLLDIIGRTRESFELSGSGQPTIDHLEPVYGDWDPLRIDQVLTNIITNAILYGKGRPISISLKNYQESVRLSVKDQGLGIPKSDHKKIFERYERGLLAREVSGLGIGLYISREIVEAHGGTIWVESEINQGSTFHVDLPRSNVSAIYPFSEATTKLSI